MGKRELLVIPKKETQPKEKNRKRQLLVVSIKGNITDEE